ncbi:MAG: UbiA family prenyltransferase [Kiritimatiellae bacterium]|nr:UbiA family prenyltransferase [Kiritimatiellia bacterium]
MIAVLSATHAEAAPLIELAGAVESTETPLRLFTAPPDRPLLIAVSGMGAAAARHACRYLAEQQHVTTIVNMGICGALDPALGPGDLCTVDRAMDADGLSGGAQPPVAPLHLTPWPDLPAFTLGTVTDPVFDVSRREALADCCQLVDMEGWAVADTCRELGIACRMVKGVSDRACSDGRSDLQRHLAPVSRQLAERFLRDRARLETPAGGRLSQLHRFTRIEHTIFSLPLLFAGAWLGAGGMPSVRLLGLVAIVGLGARTFGMAMNRILDRDLDARNPRTAARELPAGRLSLTGAYTVAAAGLGTYLAGCAALGRLCLLLAPVPLIPLAVYTLLKRFTPLCHFGIGICLAMAPLGAFVAGSGQLPLRADILLLGAFTLLWIAGFDMIYAMQDIVSDRRLGVRSIPAALGERGAQLVAGLSHLAAWGLLVQIWRLTGMGPAGGIALTVAAGGFVAAYVPAVPLPMRFFPLSVIAGIAGAAVVLLGRIV